MKQTSKCRNCSAEVSHFGDLLGIFCAACGHYEPSLKHRKLIDDLEKRHEDAQNQLRAYLKKKMEDSNANTTQHKKP